MKTLTHHKRRTQRPLLPVQVRAELTCGNGRMPDELARGVAILCIARGDDEETFYWTKIVRADSGEPLAVELTKFGDHKIVTVLLDGETCDCEDATYRPDRPGGCKHRVALHQTLPLVAAGKRGVA